MKDRLLFDTVKLSNGMTVYGKRTEDPFVLARLHVPLGHTHNTGKVLPGSAHMLEHLACSRSERFPETGSFYRHAALRGGEFGGGSDISWTTYELEAPADEFPNLFAAFMEHLQTPVISEDYLRHEAGIIGEERRAATKWFPYDNEVEHLCNTRWKNIKLLSLRQVFGSDKDLAAMSPEGLLELHRSYWDPRAHLVIGGSYDMEPVCAQIDKIPTQLHQLPTRHQPMGWTRREYHELRFSSSKRMYYHLGGFIEQNDPLTVTAVGFMGSLLVDTVYGVLYRWLRNELGWIYNMGFGVPLNSPPAVPHWELWVPLSSREQVATVRRELHSRILKAIRDKELLATALKRYLSVQVFWYQTLESVLEEMTKKLHVFGRTISEEEGRAILSRCADTRLLEEVYERCWHPNVSGEFLALPKK